MAGEGIEIIEAGNLPGGVESGLRRAEELTETMKSMILFRDDPSLPQHDFNAPLYGKFISKHGERTLVSYEEVGRQHADVIHTQEGPLQGYNEFFTPGQVVLDLPCGAGAKALLEYATRFPQVQFIGVDKNLDEEAILNNLKVPRFPRLGRLGGVIARENPKNISYRRDSILRLETVPDSSATRILSYDGPGDNLGSDVQLFAVSSLTRVAAPGAIMRFTNEPTRHPQTPDFLDLLVGTGKWKVYTPKGYDKLGIAIRL